MKSIRQYVLSVITIGVRALFDNAWLHLFALDDAGRMAWRYHGNLRWVPMIESEVSAPVAELVA